MTREQAEQIVDEIWTRQGMTDNTGTDRVRAELVDAILASYEQGKAEQEPR
jgi:hypothetical protein